jgi:predicted RNase H-like nuclease (RuvC/YqgF family)
LHTLQVKSWQDHAAKYLRNNMELQATNAALGVSMRHQQARLEESAAADVNVGCASERNALHQELHKARREVAELKTRCMNLEQAAHLGTSADPRTTAAPL